MRSRQMPSLMLVLLFALFSDCALSSVAPCTPVKGQLSSVEGVVEIGHGGAGWQTATLEAPLCEEDSVRVGPNSRAAITLIGDIVLRLDQNTTVRLVDLTEKPEERSVIQLLTGVLQSLSRAPRKLAVNTPYINGMIEGTEFLTRVEKDHADITVFEGKVIAGNDKGSLALTQGQSAEAKPGQAPQPRILVRPRDAVQWALYYPPVLDLHPEEFAATGWQANARHSVESYLNGNLQKAFEASAQVPENIADRRFLAYRAALMLSVGRVEKANSDIDRLLRLNPNDSDALALQTIIKVVQNETDQALTIAHTAERSSPDSPSVLMALSYAQQSAFDLEGARNTLEKIVKLEPGNALAWARLAELQSSFGELDEALKAAEKAAALKPNLSRTQTVLGFSRLMQVDIGPAKEAFAKAIAYAPADPLPRLGLGLAKIRDGDLAEGRHEIEIAAGLDPNNAIVRSYLGKAYYEEKRTALTDREYQTAKELDPNDPTPYFYDAIQKQTTNRPVEALQDLEKAIELNDNRAVYRSRLLLDADLAARSASQARIYSDLGFQQRALVEGWRSVNTDPSNFSAHRFLADSYAVLPRHEIARVSELLQSQLLQPLNMTPIQPHLAESNLFLIGAGGPAALAFNEFNPIFNRNGITVQANGLVGERDTYAGEGIVSGIYGKAAFSVGGFHSTSDGFRKNDDFRDDIANAFVQYEISPKTSIQAEYRYRNTDKGDLLRRFFDDNFFSGQQNNDERHTYRVGARHNLSENNILLGSFIYQTADVSTRTDQLPGLPPDIVLTQTQPSNSAGFELQHLFRSEYLNVTSGAGHADINQRLDTRVDLPPPFEMFSSYFRAPTNLKHTNAYSYGYIKPIKSLTLTLGVSGDFTSGDTSDISGINQINPKFGVMWEPLQGTTLRAAAFRGLKRSLITNQTLEPTQVAGFNQFFDDINGTKFWRYGVGLDQKFTRTVFGGAEISTRDLRIATSLVDPSTGTLTPTRVDWQENLARTYLFWAPETWLALRAEYQFEHLKRDPSLGIASTAGIEKMDTHRMPVGFNLYHPSGMSLGFTATYYNQHGVFDRLDGQTALPGQDSFWLIDAALNYRLPKRFGFVTVGASNLLNEQFQFYDTDFNNPRVHAGRMVFGKITLALP